MDRARRVERRRLRRKQRQEELQGARPRSPLEEFGDGRQATAYINRDWRRQGTASIFVCKELRSGGCAMGAFLIDLQCCGLKDCWGRLEMSAREFQKMIRRYDSPSIPMVRVEVETARRLVAGAIRFTRQNRLRLPARYHLWTPLLGVAANQLDADLADFGVDGDPTRLLYIGEMADLKERLIGESLEQAIKRTGLKFICRLDPEDAPSLFGSEGEDQEEIADLTDLEEQGEEAGGEEMETGIALARGKVIAAVERWCIDKGGAPHGRLGDALDLFLASWLQFRPRRGFEGEVDPIEETGRLLDRALECQGKDLDAGLSEAMSQLREFISGHESAADLIAALGLPPVCRDFSLQ